MSDWEAKSQKLQEDLLAGNRQVRAAKTFKPPYGYTETGALDVLCNFLALRGLDGEFRKWLES